MSFSATILGVLYISHLVSCTITNPKDYCGHKIYDNEISNPVVLDESDESCAERDVYTPPELACTFPSANFRALYTEQTNATTTNNATKIIIEEGGDSLGYANGVFYKKQTSKLNTEVFACTLFTHGGPRNRKIEYLKFDKPTDCLLWWELSACTTIQRMRDILNKRHDDITYAVPDDCRLMEVIHNHWTTYFDGNMGSNNRYAYIHGNIRLFTLATLSRSKDGKGASLVSKRGQNNHLTITNRDDLLRGYSLNPTGVYAFKPLTSQD
ncbi:hypothetical protein ElyMa_001472300 [Elysia marginata]|uniref:Uncharacterized protein n=1 Tax=Elysia marginata TaxID=1093978 RepID=A0AAV4J377_9GAST|nr:hypothetical protein ElyMa_001472300 [Elysia marginata]